MGEEVQIDSLQIEIKTSSTNAAKGIDDLAASLERLKKNGSFKTVSTNLNHLSQSLQGLSNVHGAANSLRTLANSIEKLKGVGTVSSLSNSLAKLPAALKSLDAVDLTRAKTNIAGFADAVYPLTQVKNSGFSSMVNSMAKLKTVTESLDAETLDRFAQKIKKLNEIVEPFATKMGTIKTALGGMNTQIKQTNVSMGKLGDKVNVTTLNVSNMIHVFSSLQGVLQRIITFMADVLHQASQWDGIKYQFGNAFGDQADEYYKKITKITEALNINKQAFMENSAMAASMLIGFGVDKTDAREMGLGYTQLAYDIWAAFNNVYETLDGADGAMAAVKSAIAGEVEPIRRAGFTITEATLKQTAANHGLKISLENATEAQKSYLRYLTLVDQAQSKGVIGTYAREMETAEGMMRTFSQQLKSLAQAFGSLFLPILVEVMPYVQAFVELLTEGVHWLAALFGVEIQDIGDTWNDYSSGIEESTENTEKLNEELKALKNATLGIDELNVISPTSASNGSGGSGGSGGGFGGVDIGSIWDESIFDGIQQDVDKVKEKVEALIPVIGGVALALAGLKLTQLLSDLDKADSKFLDFLDNIKVGKILSAVGITIAVGKLVWDFTGAYLEGGDENDLLKAIGTTTIGVALARWLVGKPGAAFTLLTSGVVTLTKLGIEIGEGTVEWNDTESVVTALVGGLETVVGAVFTWKTLAPMLKKVWPKIAEAAAPVLSAAGPYGWIAAAVIAGVTLALVDYDFTDIGYTIGEKIGEALAAGGELIGDGIMAAWNWAVDALEIDDFWDVLAILFVPGEWVRRITPEVTEVFTKLGEWIEEKIENLKGNINEFFGGFFDGLFDGLGWDMTWAEKFTEFFDIEYLDIVEAVMNPKSIGKHIMTGINNAIDENAKLSAIKNNLSDMWETAKTWWDTRKTKLSEYTPSIGNISTKLSTAWTAAKNWWSKDRSTLSYTPTIGSIKDKLSSLWTSAKNWWSKDRSSLSYTPTIGSIKDKLISAWNTAKKWWSDNVKLSIPSLSFKVTYSNSNLNLAQKAIVKALDLDGWPKLSFAANGGIFDQGSLIWAGERGPEVMATASGGKTGVMNVQQMQDAVYEGVYAAVVAAMRGSGGGGEQSVNVYLDGKQITAAVEKRQRERGASLMGTEVYSY